MVYKVSAIAASLGVTSLAVAAVWLRFHWHMEAGGDFPWAEAAATLLLTIGGAVSVTGLQPCFWRFTSDFSSTGSSMATMGGHRISMHPAVQASLRREQPWDECGLHTSAAGTAMLCTAHGALQFDEQQRRPAVCMV
jgi:thiol:disulfide interchange protein